MDFGINDTLSGLRFAQEEYVDRCGWDAAGLAWYWHEDRRRHWIEIGLDLWAVIKARVKAIVTSGISRHIVVREWRRARPAIVAYLQLLATPYEVHPGRLRKVFRYTYCGWDKRRNPQPVSL